MLACIEHLSKKKLKERIGKNKGKPENVQKKIINFTVNVPAKSIKEKYKEINKSLKKRFISVVVKT